MNNNDKLDIENQIMRLLVPGRVVYVKDLDAVGIIIGSFIAATKANSFIDIAWDSERKNIWELAQYNRIRFNTLYKYIKEKNLGNFEITNIVLPYDECVKILRVFGFLSEDQEKRKNIIQNLKNQIHQKDNN